MLLALQCLPAAVGATYGPVVWVDDSSREFELPRAYGKIETRWVYAFFLLVNLQAASFTRLFGFAALPGPLLP